uniref:Uncharacterized protein n=1 Tax=Anopheles maculatus TaxID=74869 RepID=A0A182SWI0_9DIPT
MHRRRRSNNDVSNNGTQQHHPSANEIDSEPNMEQDAAYYDDQQSPDYHHHHHNDYDDSEQTNIQRTEKSHYPVLRQEQEIQRGRGGLHRPTARAGPATGGPSYSGARQQPTTTLEVHAQHDLPPGEDTDELTEPLLQQASPNIQCAPHGSLKENRTEEGHTSPKSSAAATVSAPPTSKLSPSSSISSSSLSSKTSKASKTSSKRHRLRKSRSKDAQTEIEHPKAPLVVAEDSEDLDGEDEDEAEVQEGSLEASNSHSDAANFDNEDRRTVKSASSSSSRSTMVPRGR